MTRDQRLTVKGSRWKAGAALFFVEVLPAHADDATLIPRIAMLSKIFTKFFFIISPPRDVIQGELVLSESTYDPASRMRGDPILGLQAFS